MPRQEIGLGAVEAVRFKVLQEGGMGVQSLPFLKLKRGFVFTYL
jgi:hypothetical protein